MIGAGAAKKAARRCGVPGGGFLLVDLGVGVVALRLKLASRPAREVGLRLVVPPGAAPQVNGAGQRPSRLDLLAIAFPLHPAPA
jgi:hypothetical protein